jgi:hypothetical protein
LSGKIEHNLESPRARAKRQIAQLQMPAHSDNVAMNELVDGLFIYHALVYTQG